MKGVEKTMTVGELKQELADADDDMRVVVIDGNSSRFYDAKIEELEIDVSEGDGDAGYREADIFTRGTHRKRVILIV